MEYLSPGVYVEETPSAAKPVAGVSTSIPVFVSIIPDTVQLLAKGDPAVDKTPTKWVDQALPPSKAIGFYTNWSQFTAAYGGLVGDGAIKASKAAGAAANSNQHMLALAVYGFFNNGGSRCYVVRAASMGDLSGALSGLEAIDDISLVVAPGLIDDPTRSAITAHCAVATGDRFAIFDGPQSAPDVSKLAVPARSDFAAVYFPWINVFDPSAQLGGGDGVVSVPPSGHIAGVYARVDQTRGVHKAPANEVIYGALGVSQALSKADQSGLNPGGVNCIRSLNGNIVVWGARTVGGDLNADLKYVNVRRTLIFLRKSIEQGTQWIVFEPNTATLWQQINRNISAFLTSVWRSGALFGDTAKEAFYVKCDAETNPSSSRDNGLVVTEIGVALARPAEFVVFRISQVSAGG